jgi:hypothetical protein
LARVVVITHARTTGPANGCGNEGLLAASTLVLVLLTMIGVG